MKSAKKTEHSWTDWLLNIPIRGVILTTLLLPYRVRVPVMGWITRKIIAPLAGFNRRSAKNLEYVLPDMPAARRQQIVHGAADNVGRTFIENYSTKEFAANLVTTKLSGAGVAALAQAKESGQAVVLVSGHIGNYEAVRVVLTKQGYLVGAMYRPARNHYFNTHYEKTLMAASGPMFTRGREGTVGFVRHLAAGGMLAIAIDQHVQDGVALPFLGKPAATALSAARLALRYDALLVPFYGIRQTDGLNFQVALEAPIAHSDPETMTRALNASLQARIHDNPEQWLWFHRRWKIERQ